MPLNASRTRQLLKSFDFRTLFKEELGWDNNDSKLDVLVDGMPVSLDAIAHKRGMVAYLCPTPSGKRLPDYSERRKIERQVAKSTHEHFIVFTDADRTTQVWQWVRHEPGKPDACRESHYQVQQTGQALIQKLQAIAFSLEEEETLNLPEVARRSRAAFDIERVTKKFYDQFKKEHAAFLGFISGITEIADREWYASVMLNRLMFVYFIQRKGFLDGDTNYLRSRLKQMRGGHGRDKFYSFYRYFLLRLFHEGLGGSTRTPELERLLGRVPYLNGGLFDVHDLEKPDRYGKSVQIPDAAFEQVFDYFDQYQWHLDERPLRADNEINPDVLGFIFEKYINQKQMGAYYTKEDITGYIGTSTVIPFLVDAAHAECKVAFENPNGPTVWDILRADPDRYVFPSVRHGADRTLPSEIAGGIYPATLHQPVAGGPVQSLGLRNGWNMPAPAEFALPTETWREVVARRTKYEDVRGKLVSGDVRDVNDLITLNLDIRQFAQDVIENCEGPELLRAFWHAIERVTVLDPTCGSGAFLFAALNILEPLYEGCLDRMEAFVKDLDRSGETRRAEKFSDFRKVLAQVAAHPNRRYFIFKRIILNNLFGVDIMEEAVEICKLRLFLKLAAQVEPDATHRNLGIEPLPDIDFNIRAGNALVGFANYDDVKRAIASKLDFDNSMEKIGAKAADMQLAFDAFRERQVESDGSVSTKEKLMLRQRLYDLQEELNRYLAGQYGVDSQKAEAYAKWLKSYQPLHWFVEFYGIMKYGGFDVVIGNPPYIAAAKERKVYVVKNYDTENCSDIYAWFMERAKRLSVSNGRTGMIVPLSLTFSGEFDPCRKMIFQAYGSNWFSSFGRIPAALFAADVRVRNVIHIGSKSGGAKCYTTRLHRWFESYRPYLMSSLEFAEFHPVAWEHLIPKAGSGTLILAFEKLSRAGKRVERSLSESRTNFPLHFKGAAYNWLTFCRVMPPCYDAHGKLTAHGNFHTIYFVDRSSQEDALLFLNGKLAFLYWVLVGDDLNVPRRTFAQIPVALSMLPENVQQRLSPLVRVLEDAMQANASFKLNAGKNVGNYNLARCREVTDVSDSIFCEHLGLQAVWPEVERLYNQMVLTKFDADDGVE